MKNNTPPAPQKNNFGFWEFLHQAQKTANQEQKGTIIDESSYTTVFQLKDFFVGFWLAVYESLLMLLIFLLYMLTPKYHFQYIAYIPSIIILSLYFIFFNKLVKPKNKYTSRRIRKFLSGMFTGEIIFKGIILSGYLYLVYILANQKPFKNKVISNLKYLYNKIYWHKSISRPLYVFLKKEIDYIRLANIILNRQNEWTIIFLIIGTFIISIAGYIISKKN